MQASMFIAVPSTSEWSAHPVQLQKTVCARVVVVVVFFFFTGAVPVQLTTGVNQTHDQTPNQPEHGSKLTPCGR